MYPCFASILTNPETVISATDQTWNDLLCVAAKISEKFELHLQHQLKNQPHDIAHGKTTFASRWLLSVDSPFLFAASLIACWNKKITPVVSADVQSGTMAELSTIVDGALCDRNIDFPDAIMLTKAKANNPAVLKMHSAEETAIILFTSGSTGKKKQITKNFRQLFSEVNMLESTFGQRLKNMPRFSTVSHFHIYSFMFNILWPLCHNAQMPVKQNFYWEEIECPQNKNGVLIISSPAHLRFLPDVIKNISINWQSSIIFSSGAPLAQKIALQIEHAIGHAPIEVLGSTETGGIAWRTQGKKTSSKWRLFKNVKVKKNHNGILSVSSPILPNPDQWISTGDGVDFDINNNFTLTGRLDRISKIAGKRVSLTEMENHLLELEAVVFAKVINVEQNNSASREQLAAIIQIDNKLNNDLIINNSLRHQFTQTIRQKLMERFDLVTIPRKIYFVDQMPFDSQGKLPIKTLQKLVKNV